MIHLRVVSPPDVTSTVMPMLRSEPAVVNLTLHPGAVSHPDGDAVHFDVLHGAANEVIGRLRGLGLDQRGSIVLENVDTSISALADRATARQGRYQEFTPVWPEVQARVALEGTYPPSWFILLTIAGLKHPDRGVHLGNHHPGGVGHRRVAGLRQLQRGAGLGSPAPAQRHSPGCCRDRRAPGAAGHLAAGRSPGRHATA
jgi:hypothetical protein